MASHTQNGKAFEYSLAKCYLSYIQNRGLSVELIEDNSLSAAKAFYEQFEKSDQIKFDSAANNSISTLSVLEPSLVTQQHDMDTLKIRLASDAEGQIGDVRDVIFSRPFLKEKWEIGISAKNNHDAVKHSRLSPSIDFGNEWLGIPCSERYFEETKRVFDWIDLLKNQNDKMKWAELGGLKENGVYLPILKAFKDETLRLNEVHFNVPEKLVSYLVGNFPFYKVIKDDTNELTTIKSYNLKGELNKKAGNCKPKVKAPKINLPGRIIEFRLKEDSKTTLIMTLDQGWQISFRIHSASSKLETSLKFDINLIGTPPELFTQHLFAFENQIRS